MKEDDEGWVYVPPVADTFTVFPGKQHRLLRYKYMTLVSNMHQVT